MEPAIEVTRESTLETARRAGPGAACLVFASAKNPGGGFLSGAQAQEEAIARASALYPCLRQAPEFYAFHRAQRDLRYSDRVIYCPGVPVFRDDRGALLDREYTTSFLTAAAPNLGVPAAHGHRTLVLGAWGCGVFRNDPAVVADAFAQALRAVPAFDRVVFAILDRLPGTPVYHAFAGRFGSG